MIPVRKKFELKILDLFYKVIANHEHWKKIILILLGVVIALVLIAVLGKWFGIELKLFGLWIKSLGWFGVVAFIGVFIILTLFFVPESFLAIMGGVAFGLWKGFGIVIFANIVAAVIAFFIYQLLFKKRFDYILLKHPKMRAVELAVSSKGLTLMLLLRLGPFNFSLLNVILGASEVKIGQFLFSLLGVIPGNFMTVYFGILARHVAQRGAGVDNLSAVHEISLFFGFLVTVIVCLFIGRVAHHALQQAEFEKSS